MAAFEKISRLQFMRANTESFIDVRRARLPSLPAESHYNPREHREPKIEISPWMAHFNVLRTMCGAGLLGMPVALSASGLIIGSFFTILVGLIIIHTHHLLLNSLNEISKQLGIPYISYRYGFRMALMHGPPIWHGIARHGPTIIATFMIMSQLGICTVCVILTSDSLRDHEWVASIGEALPSHGIPTYSSSIRTAVIFRSIVDCSSVKPTLFFLFPCYLLLEHLMKSLKRVSYVALTGNFLNTVGLILIFYHIFKEPIKEVIWYEPGLGGWLFTSGMCMFNLSAVGVILTLDKALKHPDKLTEHYGIINVGLGIPTILSLVFGILGYWAFGTMEENVLRSLPYEDMSAMIAIGVYLVSVAFSYPLQCYPAIACIIEVIKYHDVHIPPTEATLKVIEIIARPTFVMLSFVIAYYVPFQGPFVAFVGNSCTSMLSLTFPAMMDIGLKYGMPEGYGKYHYHLIKDMIILVLGLLSWIVGIYFCGYLIYIRILSAESPNASDFF